MRGAFAFFKVVGCFTSVTAGCHFRNTELLLLVLLKLRVDALVMRLTTRGLTSLRMVHVHVILPCLSQLFKRLYCYLRFLQANFIVSLVLRGLLRRLASLGIWVPMGGYHASRVLPMNVDAGRRDLRKTLPRELILNGILVSLHSSLVVFFFLHISEDIEAARVSDQLNISAVPEASRGPMLLVLLRPLVAILLCLLLLHFVHALSEDPSQVALDRHARILRPRVSGPF